MFWRTFSAACLAAGLAGSAMAQDGPTFAVDVSVVNVLATVRDRDGNIVTNLTKDDFSLEEDGKPQEIRYFSHQRELPLTIGLLVDTSMSQRRVLDSERSASYQFLDRVLRPDQDQAFVIRFDRDVELLQDLTGSRNLLDAALDLLQTPGGYASRSVRRFQGIPGGGMGWPGQRPPWSLPLPVPGGGRVPRDPGGRRGGNGRSLAGTGTALYDAVYLAGDEVLKPQAGRKTMIVISDGVDMGSKMSLTDAIETAQRTDSVIYSIRYFDEDGYGGRGRNGAKVLERLSNETGGHMFEVSKKLNLDQIFDQIQQELRSQYNIGYTSSNTTGTGYREIRLTTKDKKLKVQARSGYYPKSAGSLPETK